MNLGFNSHNNNNTIVNVIDEQRTKTLDDQHEIQQIFEAAQHFELENQVKYFLMELKVFNLS